jgi:hypothetical protein
MTKNTKYLFIFSYLFLLFGFYIGEDLNGNSSEDYIGQFPIIIEFSEDLKNSLLNYDNLDNGNSRQSPIFFLILSIFYKFGFTEDSIRFICFNLSFSSIPIFYFCLKKKYPLIKKSLIILLTILISFSPSFRSISIWPNAINLGLIFFLLSIFSFLNFVDSKNQTKKFYFALLNILFLAISSYISPNFSVFSIYFFFKFFNFYKQSKKILLIIIFNLFLATPAFFYLFYFEQFFFFQNTVSPEVDNNLILNNLINKFSIIITIIFFYLLPFILLKVSECKIYKKLNVFEIISYIVLVYLVIIFFNYPKEISGGGIFFKLSNFLFENNFLFYLIFFLSIFYLYRTLNINLNNLILILCFFLSNPQFSIYHKYFDPLIFIVFILLFKINDFEKYLKNIKFLLNLYIFYFIFIFLSIYKVSFI